MSNLYRQGGKTIRSEVPKKTGEEIRKIQLTGKSTYIVSLPKAWVTRMKLNVGDQLAISESGVSLTLTPKALVNLERPAEATIKISQKDNPDTVMRKIIALYLIGYNLIRVKTSGENITSLQRNLLKDFTRRKLVGVETISDSENEIVLQILVSYPELSVENALRRMCLITASMHSDALKALKESDEKLAQNVITLDDEVDRFGLYVIRQLKMAVQNERILREIGLSNPKDCLGYRVIVKFVERIADHAVKIAENVMAIGGSIETPVLKRISEMSLFSMSIFNDAVKSLYEKNYLLADGVISKAKVVSLMESGLMKLIYKRPDASKTSSLRMIVESIRRTIEYASDIAEIVLNLNANQIIEDSFQ
ncbi:MAG: phosphate uptake regulator PhoU [Candidatus Brockarchaeota archaeon]|nr:phosphate uptake regulator PhoU [Candidatus Brockarchaeota archaeon]